MMRCSEGKSQVQRRKQRDCYICIWLNHVLKGKPRITWCCGVVLYFSWSNTLFGDAANATVTPLRFRFARSILESFLVDSSLGTFRCSRSIVRLQNSTLQKSTKNCEDFSIFVLATHDMTMESIYRREYYIILGGLVWYLWHNSFMLDCMIFTVSWICGSRCNGIIDKPC